MAQTIAASSRPFSYPQPGAALHCGGVSLESLARRFDTPLYVYSADQIVERLRLFEQALAGREHLVCYSVKANSALAILKLLAQNGAGFDIVSGGELERVLAAAPEAVGRVVFSGVGKTATEIDLALKTGILAFNVESEAELKLLAARARKHRIHARFALRVNPDIFAETHPYISTGLREHKFGIDIRHALGIYKSAAKDRWLEPHGVSVHIGSQIRSAAPFGAAIERVSKLMRQLRREGIALQTVNAGGGLGIDYHAGVRTAGTFDAAVKVEEYAAAIEVALGDFAGRLLIEPGRFLVAQAGALVARVLYVKRNGKKTFVITDAAMNDLIRPALYQAWHEIVPVRPRAGKVARCRCGGTGVRDGRLLCARPQACARRARRSRRPARCRRVRYGAKLQLQHASAAGGSAYRGIKGASHSPPRNHGRSACARSGLKAEPASFTRKDLHPLALPVIVFCGRFRNA